MNGPPESPELPAERDPGSVRTDSLKLFAKKVGIVLLFALGLLFLYSIRRVVILLFIAAVLAAGISPIVKRVMLLVRHHTGRRIQRGTAVILVYLPFLIGAILLGVFTIPLLLEESQQLAQDLPKLLGEKVLDPLSKYIPTEKLREMLDPKKSGALENLPIFGYIRKAGGLVASLVAILFLIFYMLIDAERLRNLFLLFYPARDRGEKRRQVIRISRKMSSWLQGQLLLALIIAGATFVGLLALGIPYAFLLAILAGIGEVVPVIGPIVGAIPAVAVALFKSDWQFWAVLAMAILIQQFENLFLVPRIMGKKIAVSPLAVFVAFMCGAVLLGIVGAMLAIPVVAIIQVAFDEGFISRRERRQNLERPGTLAKGND